MENLQAAMVLTLALATLRSRAGLVGACGLGVWVGALRLGMAMRICGCRCHSQRSEKSEIKNGEDKLFALVSHA